MQLETRETELSIAAAAETPIQEVFRLLVENDPRTELVCADVVEALREGRAIHKRRLGTYKTLGFAGRSADAAQPQQPSPTLISA